jgi:hypothetical protein
MAVAGKSLMKLYAAPEVAAGTIERAAIHKRCEARLIKTAV